MKTLTKLAQGGTVNSAQVVRGRLIHIKCELLKLTHRLKSRFSVVNWEPAVSDLQK